MNHWIKVFFGKNEDQSSNPWGKKTKLGVIEVMVETGGSADLMVARLAPGSVRDPVSRKQGKERLSRHPAPSSAQTNTQMPISLNTQIHIHITHIYHTCTYYTQKMETLNFSFIKIKHSFEKYLWC